jgi:cytochrome b subunit of formate dehydrogenase
MVLTASATAVFIFISTLILWTQYFLSHSKIDAGIVSAVIGIIFLLHWYCASRVHDEIRKEAGWRIEPPNNNKKNENS